jgi:hypothetical protein
MRISLDFRILVDLQLLSHKPYLTFQFFKIRNYYVIYTIISQWFIQSNKATKTLINVIMVTFLGMLGTQRRTAPLSLCYVSLHIRPTVWVEKLNYHWMDLSETLLGYCYQIRRINMVRIGQK